MVESVGVDVGVSDGVGARVVACTVEEELIEAGTVASSYNNASTFSSFNTKFEGTVYITPVGWELFCRVGRSVSVGGGRRHRRRADQDIPDVNVVNGSGRYTGTQFVRGESRTRQYVTKDDIHRTTQSRPPQTLHLAKFILRPFEKAHTFHDTNSPCPWLWTKPFSLVADGQTIAHRPSP